MDYRASDSSPQPVPPLGVDMMDHLSDVAIQVLQTEPKQLPFATSYLNTCVRSLQIQKQPDSPEIVERVSIFVYMDALIRLINCRKKNLDGVELSKLSQHVERDVRKSFSIQGNLSNSKFTRQKCIIYYLILALISTDSLEVQLDDILEGVSNLSRTELLKYATVVGAKVKDKRTLYIHRANLDMESKLSVAMPPPKRRRK